MSNPFADDDGASPAPARRRSTNPFAEDADEADEDVTENTNPFADSPIPPTNPFAADSDSPPPPPSPSASPGTPMEVRMRRAVSEALRGTPMQSVTPTYDGDDSSFRNASIQEEEEDDPAPAQRTIADTLDLSSHSENSNTSSTEHARRNFESVRIPRAASEAPPAPTTPFEKSLHEYLYNDDDEESDPLVLLNSLLPSSSSTSSSHSGLTSTLTTALASANEVSNHLSHALPSSHYPHFHTALSTYQSRLVRHQNHLANTTLPLLTSAETQYAASLSRRGGGGGVIADRLSQAANAVSITSHSQKILQAFHDLQSLAAQNKTVSMSDIESQDPASTTPPTGSLLPMSLISSHTGPSYLAVLRSLLKSLATATPLIANLLPAITAIVMTLSDRHEQALLTSFIATYTAGGTYTVPPNVPGCIDLDTLKQLSADSQFFNYGRNLVASWISTVVNVRLRGNDGISFESFMKEVALLMKEEAILADYVFGSSPEQGRENTKRLMARIVEDPVVGVIKRAEDYVNVSALPAGGATFDAVDGGGSKTSKILAVLEIITELFESLQDANVAQFESTCKEAVSQEAEEVLVRDLEGAIMSHVTLASGTHLKDFQVDITASNIEQVLTEGVPAIANTLVRMLADTSLMFPASPSTVAKIVLEVYTDALTFLHLGVFTPALLTISTMIPLHAPTFTAKLPITHDLGADPTALMLLSQLSAAARSFDALTYSSEGGVYATIQNCGLATFTTIALERRIRFVSSLEKAGGDVVLRAINSVTAHSEWMLKTACTSAHNAQYSVTDADDVDGTVAIQCLAKSLGAVQTKLQETLPPVPAIWATIMDGVFESFSNLLLNSLRVSQFGAILLARDIDALLHLCSPDQPDTLDSWTRLRLIVAVYIPPSDTLLPMVKDIAGDSEEGEEEVMKYVERRTDWRSGLGRSKWASEMVKEIREGEEEGGGEEGEGRDSSGRRRGSSGCERGSGSGRSGKKWGFSGGSGWSGGKFSGKMDTMREKWGGWK